MTLKYNIISIYKLHNFLIKNLNNKQTDDFSRRIAIAPVLHQMDYLVRIGHSVLKIGAKSVRVDAELVRTFHLRNSRLIVLMKSSIFIQSAFH